MSHETPSTLLRSILLALAATSLAAAQPAQPEPSKRGTATPAPAARVKLAGLPYFGTVRTSFIEAPQRGQRVCRAEESRASASS